jgi:hypothetical protein
LDRKLAQAPLFEACGQKQLLMHFECKVGGRNNDLYSKFMRLKLIRPASTRALRQAQRDTYFLI